VLPERQASGLSESRAGLKVEEPWARKIPCWRRCSWRQVGGYPLSIALPVYHICQVMSPFWSLDLEMGGDGGGSTDEGE